MQEQRGLLGLGGKYAQREHEHLPFDDGDLVVREVIRARGEVILHMTGCI
jgi:hypothetical protein